MTTFYLPSQFRAGHGTRSMPSSRKSTETTPVLPLTLLSSFSGVLLSTNTIEHILLLETFLPLWDWRIQNPHTLGSPTTLLGSHSQDTLLIFAILDNLWMAIKVPDPSSLSTISPQMISSSATALIRKLCSFTKFSSYPDILPEPDFHIQLRISHPQLDG